MSTRKKRPGRSDPLPPSPVDEEGNPIWAGPSRSQVRREASAVSDLALRLIKLPAPRLSTLSLDDELRECVDFTASLTKSARARQLRLLAKMLRDLPAERLEELQELSSPSYRPGPSMEERQYERWRERLLSEGDAALAEFLVEFPNAERQRLRQLIRQSKGEPPTSKTRRAARDLLRAIRASHLAQSGAEAPIDELNEGEGSEEVDE